MRICPFWLQGCVSEGRTLAPECWNSAGSLSSLLQGLSAWVWFSGSLFREGEAGLGAARAASGTGVAAPPAFGFPLLGSGSGSPGAVAGTVGQAGSGCFGQAFLKMPGVGALPCCQALFGHHIYIKQHINGVTGVLHKQI